MHAMVDALMKWETIDRDQLQILWRVSHHASLKFIKSLLE